ncbi:hypothetical protein C4578_02615 [Candidatus Microgenomates bacterium]|jgi:hypothetical protein|nr:MAG: hypothetical protein C4578_02615 [Candidatus Microgenomates bacterium]
MKKVCFLIFFIFFFFLPLKKAHSFSYTGLSFKPASFEITANGGDEIENVIRVHNYGSTPVELIPVVKNLVSGQANGVVSLTKDSSFYPLSSWVSVESEKILIPAGGIRMVSFKIKVPLSAKPGGYFGSVAFKKEHEDKVVGVNEIGGSLVFLKVSGEAEEKLSVLNFKPKKAIYEAGPVSFTVKLKNEGKTHLRPLGKITVKSALGFKIGEIEINFGNILPGDTVERQFTWEKKFLLGLYRLELDLKPGGQSAKTLFFAFPLKLAFLGFLISLLTLLFLKNEKNSKP